MSDELNTNIPRLKDQKRKRNKKPHSKYYNTKAWKTIRNKYLREHPLCELCLAEDKITPASEVHHKQIFFLAPTEAERWCLLTDINNCMSVCKKCHLRLHQYAKEHKLNYIDKINTQ